MPKLDRQKHHNRKIKREVIKTIKEIVTLPMEDKQVLKATDPTKSSLRQAWLKN
jgi:hypothetical protein